MHIAPNTKEGIRLYNYGKNYFKKMKCFSTKDFYSPPYNFQYEEYFASFIKQFDKIPNQSDHNKDNNTNFSNNDYIKFAISLLVVEYHKEEFSNVLVNLLLSQKN